jgi:Mce-associated membrane protein
MAQDPDVQDLAAQEPAAPAPDAPVPANGGPERDDEPAPERDRQAGPGSRWRRVPLVIGAVAVVAAGFAVWAGIQAHDLRAQHSAQNVALTDPSATSQVRRQLGSAIDTIFSYNYANTAATKRAAQRLLTGPAVRQYDTLFKLVQAEAPTEQLVLTTQVTNSGVELLIGDRARLLVFANQRDTRTTTHQTSYAGAMFAVNAVRTDGRWKIESIDTFGGTT